MPHMNMEHAVDAKKTILDILGDIGDFEVFHNRVVVAVYIRPEKTAGGIYLPDSVRDEDKHQGKIGLIVKMGRDAFDDPSGKFIWDRRPELHDWVWFRPSDGYMITLNDKSGLCRVLDDTQIRGSVPHPDMVW